MIRLTKKQLVKYKIKLGGFTESPSNNKPTSTIDKKIDSIKQSTYEYKIGNNYIAIVFHGAKLCTINQIFANLQSQKFKIFKYKKTWHTKIKEVLKEILKLEKLPIYDSNIELTVFRIDKRLVDEDALVGMFKFIIDGLKIDAENIGIIKDDNKTVIKKITCLNYKGEPAVGIKIKLAENNEKEQSIKDFLGLG